MIKEKTNRPSARAEAGSRWFSTKFSDRVKN
jgi:hypothetical protein